MMEREFVQAKDELHASLRRSKLFENQPYLSNVWRALQVPERIIEFRVIWENDIGEMQINRGYRVQFSSVMGPYKGGLRYHPTVNTSILKSLAFEQTFKNALTGLSMGGAKGGIDVDPKGKSDNEIRKVSDAFMKELSRHIGENIDVPAGDIGVGCTEVSYLFGAYRRHKNLFEGALTGKGLDFGGSLGRVEATGHGIIYFLNRMIAYASDKRDSIEGKRVAISGSGNVAQYAALKALDSGAILLSLSDSRGSIIARDTSKGITKEVVEEIAKIKLRRKSLFDLQSEKIHLYEFREGERPWTLLNSIDIAIPCATQNEISKTEADALVLANCRYVVEGSNMGCSIEAISVFEEARVTNRTWLAPGKAANAGGTVVSGFEMAQNSSRTIWSGEKVESNLADVMENIFNRCIEAAEQYTHNKGQLPSLVDGANIHSFMKVAEAMRAQGDVW